MRDVIEVTPVGGLDGQLLAVGETPQLLQSRFIAHALRQ